MREEWYTFQNPPREWVERYAHCPGLRWNFRGTKTSNTGVLESVTYHRTHAPLITDRDIPYSNLLPSFNHTLLRPYQNADTPFLLHRRASILGYEMRLGKTATATAACYTYSVHAPIVIIGPLIARDIWRDWCQRIHGFEPVALESKSDIPMPGFPAYFVHFDIADYHSKFLNSLTPSTLIIDEIHLLQARKSKRLSAITLLAQRSERIIGLSGTPMWSNPRSMWPILNMLQPGAWGSEFEFCQRYTDARQSAYGWQYEGIRNEHELQLRLSELVIRRTWKDVLGHLPQVTNVLEPVALTASDRAKYETLASKAQLAAIGAGQAPSQAGYLSRLRRLFGQAKVARAVQLAKQAVEDGHKVVLWTWHQEVANELEAHLHGFGWIPGHIRAEDSQDKRQKYIEAFNTNHDRKVMLAALAVGGVAIDLSSADLNIFVELDWIPATVYQATMRIFKPDRPSANVFMFADVDVERRLVDVLSCNDACQSAAGLGYDETVSKVFASENYYA